MFVCCGRLLSCCAKRRFSGQRGHWSRIFQRIAFEFIGFSSIIICDICVLESTADPFFGDAER